MAFSIYFWPFLLKIFKFQIEKLKSKQISVFTVRLNFTSRISRENSSANFISWFDGKIHVWPFFVKFLSSVCKIKTKHRNLIWRGKKIKLSDFEIKIISGIFRYFCLFCEKSTNNSTWGWEIKTKFSFLKRVHFRLKMATLITTIIWHPALSSWNKTKVCSMESSKKVKSIDVKLTNQKTIEALSILRWIRNKRRYCLSNHWF